MYRVCKIFYVSDVSICCLSADNFDRSVNSISTKVGRLYIVVKAMFGVIRPATVTLTLKYTLLSWKDNLHGTGGILAKAMRGLRAIAQSRFGLFHLMQNFLSQCVILGTKDTGRFAQICFTVKWYVWLFELGFYYSYYIHAVFSSGVMH